MRLGGITVYAALLSACSVADLSGDLTKFSDSVSAVESGLSAKLDDLQAEELRSQRAAAAENKDDWYLSDGCNNLVLGTDPGATYNCIIEKDKFGEGGAKVKRGAIAAQRKINVLVAYSNALAFLMSDSTEKSLTTGFSDALGGLQNLATASGDDSSDGLLGRLSDVRADASTATKFLIRRARLRKLRQLVRGSDADVATIVLEIRLIFTAIDQARDEVSATGNLPFEGRIDAEYWRLFEVAEVAETAAEDAETPEDRLAAFDALEKARRAFLDHEKKSPYGQVRRIATSHRALAARLDRRASLEETIAFARELDEFVQAVKGVAETVEGEDGQ